MSFTGELGGGVALLAGAAALLGTAFSGVHPEGPPPEHTGGFGEPTCHACHFDAPPDPEEGDLAIRPLGPADRAPLGSDTASVPDTATEAAASPELCVLEVRLRSPDMRNAGFQLSARHAGGEEEGSQAGQLVVLDDRVQVVTDPGTGVQYAGQTSVGSRVASGGVAGDAGAGPAEVAWRVGWRPAGDALGPCSAGEGASPGGEEAGGRTDGSTAPAQAPEPPGGPSILLHAAANAGNDDASPFGDRVYTAELEWPPQGADGAGGAAARVGAAGEARVGAAGGARVGAAGGARAGPDFAPGARGPVRAPMRR